MTAVDLSVLLFFAGVYTILIIASVWVRNRAPKPTSLGIIRSLPNRSKP